MNIDRQIAISKPVLIERAGCIYIDDFVIAIKKIIDSWNPGTYNISYNFTRNPEALRNVYPQEFEVKEKLGRQVNLEGYSQVINCLKLLT